MLPIAQPDAASRYSKNKKMKKIYINTHLDELDLDWAFTQLSEQRRDYLQRFRHERSRRAGAAAYLLLQQGLRELFGIEEPPTFAFGEHGKPYLSARPDIHFSLSHCREAAACVVATEPVGIDVESLRSFSPALLQRTMSESESAIIRAADEPQRAFARLWTCKEAYLKLTGTGLIDELHSVLPTAANEGYAFETTESLEKPFVMSLCSRSKI